MQMQIKIRYDIKGTYPLVMYRVDTLHSWYMQK